MMLAPDLRGERLPLRIKPGMLVATLRFPEIRQSGEVVLAFAFIDNAHA